MSKRLQVLFPADEYAAPVGNVETMEVEIERGYLK